MSDVLPMDMATESNMEPVERAKADLRKLRADLLRAETQVVALNNRILKVEAYIEMVEVYESEVVAEEPGRTRFGVAAHTVRTAVQILAEAGRRMHTREVLEELGKRGVTVAGKDPAANLSGFLSRAEELHNNRAEGWGLRAWGNAPTVTPLKAAEPIEEGTEPEMGYVSQGRPNLDRKGPPSWEPPGGSDLDDEIPF